MNLRDLLGREDESFLVRTQIVHNGYTLSIRALGDTGANGFIFIDTNLAIQLAKFFTIRTLPLGTECAVQGYDGGAETPITHALILNLIVDGRRQLNLPMLIVNLGRQDIILGRKWFADYGVLADCKNKRLIWPEEQSMQDEVCSKLATPIPRTILKREHRIQPEHQADAIRRDRLMEREIRQGALKCSSKEQKYQPSRTEAMDRRDNLAKMGRELQQLEDPQQQEKKKHDPQAPKKDLLQIDIALIGAAAFHRHTQKRDTEVFITSLHEIDRMIEEKQGGISKDPEEELIAQTLPACYSEYKDVFSKVASDMLPPRRPIDYKIELEDSTSPAEAIGYGPLWKQSAEELEAAKNYIVENLAKGFIVPGNAPFASPILMAKKPGGGLRFCVDYRKLNSITKKDRYPLPLIDELMQRLGKAKIFTKLDIRQGFHRIRISSESEDLTTFRTRYGTYKYRVVPFGLTNGPAAFQRFVNEVFMDFLDDFLTAFIDDLLIYSENELDHQVHVKKVLERLRTAGLQASIKKCEFHVTRTKYLGFIITNKGIKVDPEKTMVIKD